MSGTSVKNTDTWNTEAYHRILCEEMPAFMVPYSELPVMRRLSGVGLLCGTDWTPLFHNRFFYSRLDHSIGTALIVWRFTQDKAQALAALFHDISTPAFSHVTDFRNGDALRQESTEQPTARMIAGDERLCSLLAKDGLSPCDVDDYHRYPVADNDIPGLSADRLEYMYPSGAALCCAWTLDEIRQNFAQVCVLENERGLPELGFAELGAAQLYTERFCAIGRLLQQNEDKVAMQLMADVLSRALSCGFVTEEELYALAEAELISRFESLAASSSDERFARLFRTFRTMERVEHTDSPLPDAYCVSLRVKRRYVDPLVASPAGTRSQRISTLDTRAASCIAELLAYEDSPWGCVSLAPCPCAFFAASISSLL